MLQILASVSYAFLIYHYELINFCLALQQSLSYYEIHTYQKYQIEKVFYKYV